MINLKLKTFGGFLFLFVLMFAVLFIPAGTFKYWQAWAYLGIFFLGAFASTIYLMKNDPKLLERRTKAGPIAEKETSQKIIQTITALGFIAMLVLPALDYRFHWWPQVPFFAEIIGDALVAIGFIIIFIVFKQNSFASATIEIAPEQKVVSAGLYSFVRHPMYMGALILFIGMILSLGSWWGLVAFLLMLPALIWRIFDEEKFLTKNLPGYAEYKNKVRYRLVPFIW